MKMDLIEQINNHDYLHLENVVDKGRLRVELFISEASSECWDEETNDLNDLTSNIKAELAERRPCKKYKFVFEEYAIYSIVNESLTVSDEYENFSGNLYRKYSKSRFMDYVSVGIDNFIVENTKEKKIIHFGIISLNNIVNIAAFQEPKIKEII